VVNRLKDKSAHKSDPPVKQDAASVVLGDGAESGSLAVFWPADLLPKECPGARILVYGYDTKVTKYLKGSTNKSSILSHSKDMLYALSRERKLDRPLIIVAHSLGGIIVKEV
jgi:hypothetical protein